MLAACGAWPRSATDFGAVLSGASRLHLHLTFLAAENVKPISAVDNVAYRPAAAVAVVNGPWPYVVLARHKARLAYRLGTRSPNAQPRYWLAVPHFTFALAAVHGRTSRKNI